MQRSQAEEAAVRLEEHREVRREPIARKAPPELAPVDQLVRKLELEAGAQRPS